MKRTCKQLVLTSTILALILFVGYLSLYGSELLRTDQLGLTLADFEFVYFDISLDEIREILGEPSMRGISMYKNELADGNEIVLRMPGEKLKGIWILHGDGTRKDFFTGETILEPNLSDFNFLERGMMYDEVIKRVGEPYTETGSGIPVAIYELTDGRNLVLHLGTKWARMQAVVVIVIDAWVVSQDGSPFNFFE